MLVSFRVPTWLVTKIADQWPTASQQPDRAFCKMSQIACRYWYLFFGISTGWSGRSTGGSIHDLDSDDSTWTQAKVYHFFVLGEFRGFRAYRAIAGIVLCVTGAEALYADMGHFGAGKTGGWQVGGSMGSEKWSSNGLVLASAFLNLRFDCPFLDILLLLVCICSCRNI